jgi:hypothetical protein
VILTKELLSSLDCCPEGYKFGLENNLIDNDYDYAILFCKENGQVEFSDWLLEQKSSEVYVRSNGSVFTMGAYQVFSPFTGQHTRYETEEEARLALIDLAKNVLDTHTPGVVQELSNENGDTAWIPTDMHKTLNIS